MTTRHICESKDDKVFQLCCKIYVKYMDFLKIANANHHFIDSFNLIFLFVKALGQLRQIREAMK
jgi:hypothetical protein